MHKSETNNIEELMEERIIAGKKAFIYENGGGGPLIFWGMFPFEDNEVDHLIESVTEIVKDKEFTLIAFQVEDWNRDFSPWRAPAAFGDKDFSGGGPETLSWLTKEFAAEIQSIYGSDKQKYLIGYSLAGLFALWSAYESDMFSGIVCGSGSLWFRGWDVYVKEHRIQHNCNIYLSLGGKEEKTKNAVMATVGDRTREQEKVLKRDPKVKEVTLEWNCGGHFADSGKRLAKGIKWLLEQEDETCEKTK